MQRNISYIVGIGLAVCFIIAVRLSYTGIAPHHNMTAVRPAAEETPREQLSGDASVLSALKGMVQKLSVLFDLQATQSATLENVVWTVPVNVTVSGNSIQKNSGCDGCGDSGAISSQQVTTGDGYVEFTVPNTGKQLYVGLSNGNTNTSEADIDFAINTTGPGSTAAAYENDVYKADTGTAISAGDSLRVSIQGGLVTYSRNGVVFYTSTRTPQYPLLVDTSLLNTGARVNSAVISFIPPDITPPDISNGSPTGVFLAGTTGATLGVTTNENATCRTSTTAGTPYASMLNLFTTTGGTSHLFAVTGLTNATNYSYYVRCRDSAGNANTGDFLIGFSVAAATPTPTPTPSPTPLSPVVIWTNIVNAIVSGVNNLRENCGCWNSGATSSQTIASGNGYSEFTVGANPYFVAGLSKGNANQSESDIDFGVRFNGAGAADIYENGVYKGGDISYAINDVFRVAVVGGQVRYSKNGTVFFTSSKVPAYPLLLDTSLNPGALIKNAVLSGAGTPTPTPSDTTPPVRSVGLPSGTLSVGTTQATLSLSTNEYATCKYGTAAGVAYTAIANTFGITGALAHIATVTGLTNGSTYTYFVRCRDLAGNVNTTDFTITFSVASVAPTSPPPTPTPTSPPPTPPTSGAADPTKLPVAITSQIPLTALYNALNVPSIAAGSFYLDPLTGVKVYKLTSSTFPATGHNWGHSYAEGGDEVSLQCNGKRSVHVFTSDGSHRLIDFTPGGGVNNARLLSGNLAPASDLSFAFSNNPATPCYAYTAGTNGVIRRFDFSTMTEVPGGGWPITDLGSGQYEWPVWLHQTEQDAFFTWMRGANGSTIVGYEPSTGTKKTYTNSGLNEPRIDRDAANRSVAISMTTPQNQALFWDWRSNSITWSSPLIPYAEPPVAHHAGLRGYWVGTDWNANYPWPFWSISAVPNSVINPLPGGIAQGGGHCSGNWIQRPANPKDQWFVCYSYGGLVPAPAANLAAAPGGILMSTANGQRRVLAHLYNTSGDYTFYSFAKFAPDGKYVLFTSNMNGSSRSDLFLAELPTSP